MALVTFNDNVKLNAPKHIDTRYMNLFTPYASTAAANAAIPLVYRYLGLTVLIGITEYWYQSSTADVGLIAKIGGVTAITANNGLNMSTATNAQLGGAILQNTLLDTTGGDFKIYINGSSNIVSPFIVTNALNQPAILGQATSGSGGIAIKGVSTTGGISIQGQATNGIGIYGTATVTGGVGLYSTVTASGAIGASINASSGAQPLFVTSDSLPSFFNITATSTNTVLPVAQLVRQTTTNGANNIGASIEFYLQKTAAGTALSNQIISEYLVATNGSQTSQLRITGVNAGATVDKIWINSTATSIIASRFAEAKGADVVSANNLTVGTDGNLFHITGTTQINAMTVTNWQAGSRVTLIFNASVTVKHNTAGGGGTAPFILAGAIDFAANANDTLTVAYDGTGWYELTRKTTVSGGVYTFRNGLTESPATFVGLGGTLLNTTTIDPSTFGLSITGGASALSLLTVSNTNTGAASSSLSVASLGANNAISATSNTGDTIIGTSTSGAGISGISSSGLGGHFSTTTGAIALQVDTNPASTNTVVNVLTLNRNSSGTGATGIGASISYGLETTTTNSQLSNSIVSKWTDATHATRTSQLIFQGVNSGVTTDKLYIGANQTQVISTRFNYAMGASVASANNLTLGTDGNLFVISGNTQINAITTADWQAGSVFRLYFQSTPTVKNNTAGGGGTASIFLTGNADYTAAASDILTLVYDGTAFREAGRTRAGSAGTYTFTSGVTEAPAGTVKLGGTLSQNTIIDGSTSFQLTVQGSAASSFNVINTNATPNSIANFTTNPTAANTVVSLLSLTRNTTGTGANGIGGSVDFYNQTSTTAGRLSNQIISTFSNATDANRTSQMLFNSVNNTSTITSMTLNGAGSIRFNSYGVGSFTGTPAKVLMVDSSGNLLEGNLGAATLANNGVSISGTTVNLGQNYLDINNPAVFLNNREIPLGTGSLLFTGIGNGGSVYFKSGANQLSNRGPQISFMSSSGTTNWYIFVDGTHNNYLSGSNSGLSIDITGVAFANIGFGNNTFRDITTGHENVSLGGQAHQGLTTGAFNVAIGVQAAQKNTTGTRNTVVGYQALFQNVTGINNVAVGCEAGTGNYSASSDNVHIGTNAGARFTAAANSVNQAVIIGSQAYGLASSLTGTGTIAIGYNINGGTQNHGSDIILIGANCITGGSNVPSNSTGIGQGLNVQISNIVVLGRADQNTILGKTTVATGGDSGDRLQVYGTALIDTLPTTVNNITPIGWDNTTHKVIQYVANNGLTAAATGMQLGGTLLQNTTISHADLYQLSFTHTPVISIGDSSAQTDRVLNVVDSTSSLPFLAVFTKIAPLSNSSLVISGESFLQVSGTTFTGTTAGSHTDGLDGQLWMNYSGAVSLQNSVSTSYAGVYGAIIRGGAGSYSGNVLAGGYFGGYAASTGNASDIAGILVQGLQSCPVAYGALYSGTVTNYYGILVQSVAASSLAGNCTNRYGIYIKGTAGAGVSNVAESAFTTPSDRRIKENIRTSSYGLAEIEQLSTTEFTLFGDPLTSGREIGFIAQDVESVLPEAVKQRGLYGYDDFRLLDKDVIFSVMVNAIKELSAKNKALSDEVDILKAK